MCRPLVTTTTDHFSAAFGTPSQPILAEYDTRTGEALSRLISTLPTAVAQDLLAQLDEALSERELFWRNVLAGAEDAMRDLPRPSFRHARGITPDDGDGDDEHPLARKRMEVQGIVTAYVDTGIQEGLLQKQEGESSWEAHTRLVGLGAADVDHTWLWRLNPHHGATLEPEEYIDTIRLRCLPVWTRALLTPPAVPWARPPMAKTRSQPSSLLPLSLATTLPRWFPASSLAPTYGLLTSSPQPSATRTPLWTFRSARRTPGSLVSDCTRSRLVAKLDFCGPHLPSLRPDCFEC